jgi:hypothetical protein
MDDRILKELRLKVENEEKKPYRIFLDLDGVIVDFEGGMSKRVQSSERHKKLDIPFHSWDQYRDDLLKYFNTDERNLKKNPKDANPKKAKQHAIGSLWKLTRNDESFWSELEWMTDGQQLWEFLLNLKDKEVIGELNVLSSPSSDPTSKSGKLKWLDKHGLTQHLDNIHIERDKFKFATGPKDILVDDTPKKVAPWEEKTGTGILHKNTEDTIKKLIRELGL